MLEQICLLDRILTPVDDRVSLERCLRMIDGHLHLARVWLINLVATGLRPADWLWLLAVGEDIDQLDDEEEVSLYVVVK